MTRIISNRISAEESDTRHPTNVERRITAPRTTHQHRGLTRERPTLPRGINSCQYAGQLGSFR